MEIFKWAGVIGLILDIIGSAFLVHGLIISKQEASKLGSAYYAGADWKENLEIPPIKDRLKQSNNAIIGLVFLVLGFAGQLIAAWPK